MRGFVALVLALWFATAHADDPLAEDPPQPQPELPPPDDELGPVMAQASDVQLRDTSIWRSLPIDLYIDMGVRVDTDHGIFEFAFANALGRLR